MPQLVMNELVPGLLLMYDKGIIDGHEMARVVSATDEHEDIINTKWDVNYYTVTGK